MIFWLQNLIIIVIITTVIFIVLSSWQSHSERSLGSRNEYRNGARWPPTFGPSKSAGGGLLYIQQATQRIQPVVPTTHSTSSIHCSCHQPGSPPLLCSTSCHSDSHAQASDVLRPHHATSFVLTSMRIIHMPSMLASMSRRRSGDDLVVALIKHG